MDRKQLKQTVHDNETSISFHPAAAVHVQISNLGSLRKLDVLDLHSNSIQGMEGLASLQDLRVLNLAGNQIRYVHTQL